MKLSDIQKLAIELGIKSDPRGEKQVKKHLEKHRKNHESSKNEGTLRVEQDFLENPYPDSRINYGEPKLEVKKVLAGIDIETAEILLADRIGGIDLIIAHHPEGKALAELHEVMHMQAEIFEQHGVPINIAEALMNERVSDVSRALHKGNHYRSADAAKLLDIAFMCSHTVCDNLGATFVADLIKKSQPETLQDILDVFKGVPEFEKAKSLGSGPVIFSGSPKNRTGKIMVEFTGGTSGPSLIYEHLSKAGIGTIIGMHMSEDARKEAQRHHINIVMTGHMSADSIGMNLFLDQLEQRGVEVIPTSGLIRCSRNQLKKPSKKPANRNKRK